MSYRVVLADDELHILRAAEFKLKRQGYDVVCANDGQEAWELVCQKTPDLLITDFQMPRLSGLDLIKRLRETPSYATIPVLMLTAKANEMPRHELHDSLGNVEIIDKPFSPRDLCNRAQIALQRAQRSGTGTSSPGGTP